ncbi:unnamed protein product [Adineta steineri]|uniref:Uncharacterized protein n=1 Tax=Adineta steineri TaxID=433720 RepID=A0A820FMX5_9BILA|nr:unnamed protein product [Adineta steineri]
MTKAILFVLLLISIYQINASIPLSTLKSDAKELTSIHKEYLNIPIYGIFRQQFRETSCNYMKKCCSDLRSDYFSMFFNGTFASKCSKHENVMAEGTSLFQCAGVKQEYHKIKTNPIVNQSAPLLSHDKQTVAYHTKIRMTATEVCSKTELEHYVCDSDDLTKYQSCTVKFLQQISADYGEEYYKIFIQRWKTTKTKDNQKLTEYFSKH